MGVELLEPGQQRLRDVIGFPLVDADIAVGANINADKIGTGVVDNTEFDRLNGITSAIEEQGNKGAISGYAGLDASQELLLTNFPAGAALDVLRRNAANTALEFTAPVSGEFFGPWTADHTAGGFDLLNVGGIQINNPADTFQYIITPAAIVADRILNLPLMTATDTLVLEAFGATLTNKILALGSNTISGTAAQFDTAVTDDNFAFVSDNLSVFAATTSLQLAGVISDETGSGLLVFGTNATLVTPTIVSFANATHSHLNAAGGGTITKAAISDTPWAKADIPSSTVYEDEANTWGEFRQTFNPSVTIAGLNVGAHTADQSIPIDGDIIYNSTTNKFRFREAGAFVELGGGSQTPWTSDIDADGFDLTDLSNIIFRTTTGAPTATDRSIHYEDTEGMVFNALTGDFFQLEINGVAEYNFNDTSFDVNQNTIIDIAQVAGLSFSGIIAGEGGIRMPLLVKIGWRNFANTDDHTIEFDGSDRFSVKVVGAVGGPYTFSTQFLNLLGKEIRTIGFLREDTLTFAQTGFIRMANASSIATRNAANSADLGILFNASDRFAFLGTAEIFDSNIFTNHPALASADPAADTLLIRDATDGLIKEVFPDDLGLGGGSQTPWVSNIDAADFSLSNLDKLEFNNNVDTPVITQAEIYFNTAITGMNFNVPTGDKFTYRINGVIEMTVNITELDLLTLNIVSAGTLNTHTIPGGTDTFALIAASQIFTNKTIISNTNRVDVGTFEMASEAEGDLIFRNATVFIRLPRGTDNQALVATATTINYESLTLATHVSGASTDLTDTAVIVRTDQINTFGDFVQTFKDDALHLENPAGTFDVVFQTSAEITSDRILTIPLLGANRTMVVTGLASQITIGTEVTGASTALTDTGDIAYLNQANTFGAFLNSFVTSTMRIPLSATPTMAVDGDFAIDTDLGVNFSHGFIKYFDGEEVVVVGMPVAQFGSPADGEAVTYNSTTNEFELRTPSGAGDMVLADVQTVTGAKTFLDTTFLLRNPANTISLTVRAGAQTVARDATFPVMGGNRTIIVTGESNQIGDTEITAHTSTKITITAKSQLNSAIVYDDAATTYGAFLQDFAAALMRIPVSAAPTIAVNGDIGIDTTITDFTTPLIRYFGTESMVVVSVPDAQIVTPTGGHVITYNATTDEFELIAAAGGSDTPWTVDHVAAGFDLNDLSNLEFRDPSDSVPLATVNAIYVQASGMIFNTVTGNLFEFSINDVNEMTLSATQLDLQNNSLILGTGILQFVDVNQTIVNNAGSLDYDVAVGEAHRFRINNVQEYSFSGSTFSLGNNILNVGTGSVQFIDSSTSIDSPTNDLLYDVASSRDHQFRIADVPEVTITNAALILAAGNNILMGASGALGFIEMGELTTPATPTGNLGKYYVKDVGAVSTAFFIGDDGVEINLTTGAEVVTWSANHDANTFALLDARFADDVDATKIIDLNLSGMTTGIVLTLLTAQTTAQTITIPNTTGADDFVLEDFIQTLTGKTITMAGILTMGTNVLQLNDVNTSIQQSGGILQIDVASTFTIAHRINNVTELSISASIINAPNAEFRESNVAISPIGTHDDYYDAGMMVEVTSATPDTVLIGTTGNRKGVLKMDYSAADEFATIKLTPPRNWDAGTITVIFKFTTGVEGAGTIIWGVAGVAVADLDDLAAVATNYGTEVTVTDTQTNINEEQFSPRTAVITLANTPTAGDSVYLKIRRDGATDTFPNIAFLLGIFVEWGIDEATAT